MADREPAEERCPKCRGTKARPKYVYVKSLDCEILCPNVAGHSAKVAPACHHLFQPGQSTCLHCGWEQPGAKVAPEPTYDDRIDECVVTGDVAPEPPTPPRPKITCIQCNIKPRRFGVDTCSEECEIKRHEPDPDEESGEPPPSPSPAREKPIGYPPDTCFVCGQALAGESQPRAEYDELLKQAAANHGQPPNIEQMSADHWEPRAEGQTAREFHKNSGLVLPIYALKDAESGQIRPPTVDELLNKVYVLMEAFASSLKRAEVPTARMELDEVMWAIGLMMKPDTDINGVRRILEAYASSLRERAECHQEVVRGLNAEVAQLRKDCIQLNADKVIAQKALLVAEEDLNTERLAHEEIGKILLPLVGTGDGTSIDAVRRAAKIVAEAMAGRKGE